MEHLIAARHMIGLEAKGCRNSCMICLHNCRTQCTHDRLGRKSRDVHNPDCDIRGVSLSEEAPCPDIDRVGLRGNWERGYSKIQHGIQGRYCALLKCVMAYNFFDVIVAKALAAVAGWALNAV